ncbi:MAG: phosphatidate cytidylyltransferase [Actinomycetota bacterium]
MAGDKRNGDDLFEDLDKFFAPIKDVDWDEPASAGARETPSEEHVSIRADEPEVPAPASAESAESAGSAGSAAPAAEELEEPEEPEDEDWYDTTVLETIEGIGVDDEEQVVAVGAVADAEVGTEVVGEVVEPVPGQAGLFGQGHETEDEDDGGWGAADDEERTEGDYAEATLVGADEEPGDEDLDTETAPIATIDELMGGVESPDEVAVERAAEYFAPSVREEAVIDEPEQVVVGGEGVGWDDGSAVSPEVGGTLIGELGADEIERDILSDLGEDETQPETVMVGAGEGLGGPSWQEPGAVEVGADVERRGPGPGERDVPAAFLTGAVLAIAALAALLIGDWLFGLLAAAIVLLAQGELFGVMVKHRRQPATAVGLVAGALMLAAGYFQGESAVLAMFALGVAATFLWFMSGPASTRKDVTANIGLTVLNMAWVPLLGSYLLVLLEGDSGTSLVVSVIGLTFVYDTAAFLSGSVWGGQFFQRPLAPTVSPKKSVEGVIIGSLVTVVVAVTLVTSFVDPFENLRIEALLLGLVVAAAATFGDLAESLVKRDVGIKDMGSILPGHGGVLDRIDSLLFVAPAAFFLYRIIVA